MPLAVGLIEFAAKKTMSIAVIIVAIVVRCWVGFHGYSGYQTPPMFGDYEAQRHWMEITTSIPINNWYHETKGIFIHIFTICVYLS